MKYKLIKKYPELGTVATTETHGSFILNQPEFWEEIIEKDYEILSFIRIAPSNYADDIFSLNGGVYSMSSFNNNLSLDHCLTSGGFNIHSIKRLSDGEVFTVGDKVRLDFNKESVSKTILKIGFERVGSCFEKLFIYTDGEQSTINNYVKAGEPLFTTEDRVDIYEGDSFWFVKHSTSPSIFFDSLWCIKKVNNYSASNTYFKFEPQYEKYFSTKEAAEKYLIMNKPCLSINDIITPNKVFEISLNGVYMDKLKELVKSKLT